MHNTIYAAAHTQARRVSTLGPRVLISATFYPVANIRDRIERLDWSASPLPLPVNLPQNIIGCTSCHDRLAAMPATDPTYCTACYAA